MGVGKYATNRNFIEWNVTLVLKSGERTRLATRGIQVSPLVINGTSFNITVQGSIPGSLLTSTLIAPEPISHLNGTEVSCIATNRSRDDAITASTTIHVTEGGKYYY